MQDNPSTEQVTLDPVLSNAQLPLQRMFYPYGFPLELETNSEDVLEAAEEGWGAFEQANDESPVRFCLGVREGDGEALPEQSATRARGHLISINGNADNFALCDLERGFGFGWVTPEVAADHPLLRYRFLHSAAATLVEQRWLASMHGALIVHRGVGVMLCGDSFAGKSTLAYACARAGWTLVSDDGAFLVRSRTDRYAVGDPYAVRFREDAPSLFPELAERMPVIRPNGKIAIEVLTRELDIVTAPGCVIDHIVFLNRDQPGSTRLHQGSTEKLAEMLEIYSTFGTDETREAQRRCHRRLFEAGLWEMDYSELDGAIARLERLAESGG